MKEYWNGNNSLSKTFWYAWVIGSLVSAFVIALIAFLAGYIFSVSSIQLAIATFIFLLLFNPYYIFCWVAMWRSSKNTETKAIQILAKALVVAHVAIVVYDIASIQEITSKSF